MNTFERGAASLCCLLLFVTAVTASQLVIETLDDGGGTASSRSFASVGSLGSCPGQGDSSSARYVTQAGFVLGSEVPLGRGDVARFLVKTVYPFAATIPLSDVVGEGASRSNRRAELANEILVISQQLTRGDGNGALNHLMVLKRKVDGVAPPSSAPDWLEAGPIQQVLLSLINEAISNLAM